jgi:hypothetical protein
MGSEHVQGIGFCLPVNLYANHRLMQKECLQALLSAEKIRIVDLWKGTLGKDKDNLIQRNCMLRSISLPGKVQFSGIRELCMQNLGHKQENEEKRFRPYHKFRV